MSGDAPDVRVLNPMSALDGLDDLDDLDDLSGAPSSSGARAAPPPPTKASPRAAPAPPPGSKHRAPPTTPAGVTSASGATGALPRARKTTDRATMNRFLQTAVFGSAVDEDSMDEERRKEEALKRKWLGLLHPDTPAFKAYNMLQLFIMLYLAWILPTRSAFHKKPTGWGVFVDIFIDMSVYVDIVVNMNVFYYDSKTHQLITDKHKIKKGYMSTWFFIDFFSVFPMDQVLLVIGSIIVTYARNDEMAEIGYLIQGYSLSFRMLRLLRLVRLGKLKKLLDIENLVSQVHALVKRFGVWRLTIEFYFNVLVLLGIMVGGSHFLGCLWLYLGRFNVLTENIPSGWMVNEYAQWSCSYESVRMARDPDSSWSSSSGLHGRITNDDCPLDINRTRDFVACISRDFDAHAWNSVHGYSCKSACAHIPPDRPHDVDCSWILNRAVHDSGNGDDDGIGASEWSQYLHAFYFALVTISTVGYGDVTPDTEAEKKYAYIIGDFSNLLTNMGREKADFDFKMRRTHSMLGYINAPDRLVNRVQEFYDFKFANKDGPDELLDELPPQLQSDLVYFRWSTLIDKVPFFMGVPKSSVIDICTAMKSFCVSPSDFVFEEGQESDALLILSKGAALTEPDELKSEPGAEYEVGTFWGELQFLGLVPQRTLTVKATLFCEVASLVPADIEETLNQNVGLKNRLKSYGEMRMGVEEKMRSGEPFNMEALLKELDDEYKRKEAEEEARKTMEVNSNNSSRRKRPPGFLTHQTVPQALAKLDKRMTSLEKKLDLLISLQR